MNEIKIYLRLSGSLAYLYKDFNLYEGCYRNSQLTVFVPKSLLYKNENGTFVNLIKTGAILTAPNGKKLTTKTYYLDYERDQTIGGVEFRVYTTITPKEFCVYAGTQTVVVNVESIDNTTPDAQTIISVTTTQTADLIVLESAYLGQDEPIDPTELDKIKATLTEIQNEIGGLPNKYVTVDTNQTISGNKTHTGINTFNGFTSINGVGIDADAIVKGSDRFKYPVKSGTLSLTSDIPENIVTRDENEQIKVPLAPAQDDDAVSKKYVDDADNTKLNKVNPAINGSYAYTVSKSDIFGTTNGYTEISETDKIKTIAKRKANGCIETRTPSADIEAANKGYVDTAISDTQGQLAQTNQNVEDLYTILEQAQVVTVTTLEQAYTTRETADGENIVDGVQTTVKEIRGKTVATENLIPYPYTETTRTANGVTFTVNSDGSVTVNGTATSDADFMLLRGPIQSYSESYFLSGCPTGGSDTTYYISEGFTTSKDTGNGVVFNNLPSDQAWRIVIKSGTTVNNLVFRPMLNAGTTAKPYSKWFAGLKNASFEKIVSTGRNLIDPATIISGYISDADFTISGNKNIYRSIKCYLPAGKYTLQSSVAINIIRTMIDGNYLIVSIGNLTSYTFTTTQSGYVGISFRREDDTNWVDDTNIWLVFSNTATAYEPYISDTLSADTPIELAEYDVAFPETGETKRQSNTLTFDGTEEWYLTGNAENNFYNYRYYTPISVEAQKTKVPCICNKYDYKLSVENDMGNDIGILVIRGYVYIRLGSNSTIKNVAEWKAHLAELAAAGNPVTVTYKTAESTTESTPFNKSKYIAWKNGSETIEQGETDNSEYGAENTVKQDYFTLTGGTTNV